MTVRYVLCFLTFNILVVQNTIAGQSDISTGGVEFDESFVKQAEGANVDLKRFSNGANVLPGIYKIAILLNKEQLTIEKIEFKETTDKNVTPCIPSRVFNLISFKKDQIAFKDWDALAESDQCINLNDIIPEATLDFDSESQQLNISIPQIYINHQARGSVPPSMWDSGIPALMLGYNMNAYKSVNQDNESKSFYSAINSGLNIGSWYFRHNGSYNWMKDSDSHYNVLNTYVQHDLPVISGRLVAGQSNTSGQLFDTVPITGIQVASDERMLPESQRGYAPEIHGVARTNAKVTVKQSGQTIYETTVSPGAFLISDLYPTGYGGNLDVTIEEADGSQQNFSIPYASVSQLLRPGSSRYSLSVGQLRSDSISGHPGLAEGTYQRGFTNILTGYTGIQANKDYQAVKLGTAIGLPIGALSFDVTQSKTHLPSPNEATISGQSYQVSYSKLINETNSNITLAAYRFSSSGYMDYSTAMQTIDQIKNDNENSNEIRRQKNRFTVNISQGLGDDWGQLYISASTQDYWGQNDFERQYQMGYSNRYKQMSYSINASRSQDAYGTSQTSYFLNLSFPLGENHSGYAPQVSMSYNHDSEGRSEEQAMVSGSAGTSNQYTYNVSGARDSGAGSSGSFGGSYKGSISSVSGSYSTGAGYHSASLSASGTVVAHSGGVTFSPYTGDTFALVEAKGAEGATIPSFAGLTVDRFGYALFPASNPYQMNDIVIDPKGMSKNVELENTSQKVVPRYGAVVKVKFNAEQGIPLLIVSSQAGKSLPFGADVFDENNKNVGVVAQGSMIYARVSELKGRLHVKWGDDAASQCSVSYFLAPLNIKNNENVIQHFDNECS
ncbi:fimbria/pilus outer membrane usher protein [Hafnia alvei]|uniref:fimbria/pilus outer membrane usher protein n=2 Tax=Hafnia alvei TaxID=569 RepID=UPI0024A9E1DA|nr:fimbria/pilus outer membrane usher protein [Hafnia alvei]